MHLTTINPNTSARSVIDDRSQVDPTTLAMLTSMGTHTSQAVAALADLGAHFAGSIGFGGVADDDLVDWINQGDHIERRDRYATIRTLELLRVRAIDLDPLPYPNIDLPSPDRHLRRRPLQPTEIGLVRLTALYLQDLHVASVAVLDSGGTAGDLAGVGPEQVVITDRANGQGFFVLCGTAWIATRTNPIPAWSFDRVLAARDSAAKREKTIGDSDLTDIYPSICTNSRKQHNKVVSAALMNVKTVLDLTGLRQDLTVEPASIRNTFGREIWNTSGLEEAGRLLGVNNFNGLRKEIGATPHKPVRKKSQR